jgi:hypothetical protein
MINYKDKYLKYKNKYLQLKNQTAGIVSRDIIFNIQDIEQYEMNKYLNPLFGYVYYSNGFIFNYKHFFLETSIGEIINHPRFFIQVDNIIKPSNHLLPKLECREIGIIAALLYLICIKKSNIEKYKKILENYPIYKSSSDEKKNISDNSKRRSKDFTTFFYNKFFTESNQVELLNLFNLLLVILWWKIGTLYDINQYYKGYNFSKKIK